MEQIRDDETGCVSLADAGLSGDCEPCVDCPHGERLPVHCRHCGDEMAATTQDIVTAANVVVERAKVEMQTAPQPPTTETLPPFGWEPAPQWAKDAKEEDAESEADLNAFESGLAAMHPTYLRLAPDWKLLREQKQWLVSQDCEAAEGLLALLDAIQDQAVENGHATEAEVFGEESAQ